MQGQLTNRIGVFRHRIAALFKYANRIRGIRKLPDVSKFQNLKGDAEALARPRERRTLFPVTSKKGRVDNKSGNSQI
jgi:hypothetical protein